MVTDNAQFEKQALENAYRELEQAKGVFAQKLEEYETAGRSLVQNLQAYVAKRGRWLL